MSIQDDLFLNSEYNLPLSCGVDEVGRGPLVGDVVTAAVILDPKHPILGLNDSKKLSEKKRLQLFDEIKKYALSYAISHATPEEIDDINILQASLLAMSRAVNELDVKPSHAYIDGNKIPKDLPCEATAVVKGDSKVASIAAASILAKVTRDQQMKDLHDEFPQYGFANHKGYPTKAHLEAIETHGLIPGYRQSYKPVQRILEKN
ncbi:ribonuclease HII [Marinicellulosiphila megalodicopiae]|uniref:ribonuclease HII n=1 Tax=Marinicellulosiphila megalodicopiae TaxID=2724896 RepID=UPI003BAED7CE